MKNIFFLGFLLFLSGCVSYEIEKVRPNEIGMQEDLLGRMFSIDCEGS